MLNDLWRVASWLTVISTQAKTIDSASSSEQLQNLLQDAQTASEETCPYLFHFLENGNKERAIELSSGWLEVWLGYQLIQNQVLAQVGMSSVEVAKHLSHSRISELVGNWAIYLRYLLTFCESEESGPTGTRQAGSRTILGTGPEPDVIDSAKLDLLCEWAHVQGVPRLIPLKKWLQTTYPSELALYSLSSKKSHRQHLFHVQDACLLGCVLLESCVGADILGMQLANSVAVGLPALRRNWLVASLLHDIGYVLQVIPAGMDALGKDTADAISPVLREIEKRLRQAPLEMSRRDPTPGRSVNRLDIENHAYISAKTLLQVLDPLLDDGKVANEYNMALAAIIEHDVKDSVIDFRRDPISVLLVLCDQLQEWGRPRLSPELLSKRFLGALHRVRGTKLPSISLESLSQSPSLCILASWGEGKLLSASRDNQISFVLEASKAGEGGYEPAITWLDICRALQRILPYEHAPCFGIKLQHQLANDGIPELKRLYAFAEKEPSSRGGILDWLELVGNSQSATLVYELEGKLESLSFLVPELGRRKPLMSMPPKLYRDYSEFARKG